MSKRPKGRKRIKLGWRKRRALAQLDELEQEARIKEDNKYLEKIQGLRKKILPKH